MLSLGHSQTSLHFPNLGSFRRNQIIRQNLSCSPKYSPTRIMRLNFQIKLRQYKEVSERLFDLKKNMLVSLDTGQGHLFEFRELHTYKLGKTTVSWIVSILSSIYSTFHHTMVKLATKSCILGRKFIEQLSNLDHTHS